jgi:hypothetical protein
MDRVSTSAGDVVVSCDVASGTVVVYILDAAGGISPMRDTAADSNNRQRDIQRAIADMERWAPCKEEPREGYGQPHQTRPSRTKQKPAWWRRVAKRRRRTRLAKAHKKIMKQVAAKKRKDEQCQRPKT